MAYYVSCCCPRVDEHHSPVGGHRPNLDLGCFVRVQVGGSAYSWHACMTSAASTAWAQRVLIGSQAWVLPSGLDTNIPSGVGLFGRRWLQSQCACQPPHHFRYAVMNPPGAPSTISNYTCTSALVRSRIVYDNIQRTRDTAQCGVPRWYARTVAMGQISQDQADQPQQIEFRMSKATSHSDKKTTLLALLALLGRLRQVRRTGGAMLPCGLVTVRHTKC